MENRIRVEKCEDCPLRLCEDEYYGDYRCVAGDFEITCSFRFSRENFPKNCPLKKGPVVVEVSDDS